MQINYIATVRFPTEKAHGIQIAKMCEAFALSGHSVSLYVPTRKNRINEDAFQFYNVKNNFNVVYIKTPDFIYLSKVGFFISRLIFTIKLILSLRKNKDTLFFFRDEFCAFVFSFFIKPKHIIFESHRGSKNYFINRLLQKSIMFVGISQKLIDIYKKTFAKPHYVLAPDGVDVDLFNINTSKLEARKTLSLPLDSKIIMYTGHLYKWKGADVLAESASLAKDFLFVFVGGTENDVNMFKVKYGNNSNILILGQKPYKEIPLYLKSADVLVLPNTSKDTISREFTSPLKLFEYMASGVPIVASNLPSLKEILNKDNAWFVEPDNPQLLADILKGILDDMVTSESKALQAQADVLKYSWSQRAQKILQSL